MNWLITGGCGFLGRNLIKQLIGDRSGDCIRVLDNFSVGKPEDLSYATDNYKVVSASVCEWKPGSVQVIEGDVLDAALTVNVAAGSDVVVHFAANTGVAPSVQDPRSDCMTNVIGTFNLLESCRANHISRFVFASSGAPIGECSPPIHEELACHPVSPYGASKLAGEGYCSAYARTFGIDTVALRFGNVYGPGSSHKSSLVAKFIRQAVNGETLEIYGDGKQTRDFIYVKDLVRAVIFAGTKPGIGGEVFQIATNRETTVNEITESLVQALESSGVSNVKIEYGPKQAGDVMRNFSDISKARDVLGWTVEYQLQQGLQNTIKWFLSRVDVHA